LLLQAQNTIPFTHKEAIQPKTQSQPHKNLAFTKIANKLEQACELGRGNAIHQLQQNYQTSNEVAQISTSLRKVLSHLRDDPSGGRRRTYASPRCEPTPTYLLKRMNTQDEKGDYLGSP